MTKNSRLFAVNSTTCSTLLEELVAVFSRPIDIRQALVQHTQCPCRFVILATKNALYSRKLRDGHIYIANTRYQVHTRYTHACSVCGLFSWSMAAGLLAFSSRQFALTINQSWTFVRFTLFFLPKQASWAAYTARGAKRLYIYILRSIEYDVYVCCCCLLKKRIANTWYVCA